MLHTICQRIDQSTAFVIGRWFIPKFDRSLYKQPATVTFFMLFLLTGIFCCLPEFLNILPAETVVVIENGSWQHVNKRYLEVIKWFLFFQRKHFEKVVSYFFSFSKCFEFRKHFRNRANHNYKLCAKAEPT